MKLKIEALQMKVFSHFIQFVLILTATLASLSSTCQDGLAVQVELIDGTPVRYTNLVEGIDSNTIFGISSTYRSEYISKFDRNLNIHWSKSLQNINPQPSARITNLVESANGNIVLSLSLENERYISVLNSSGTELHSMALEVNDSTDFHVDIDAGKQNELARIAILYQEDTTETIGFYALKPNYELEELNVFKKDRTSSYKRLSIATDSNEYSIATASDLYIFNDHDSLTFSYSMEFSNPVFWRIQDFNADYIVVSKTEMDIDWWHFQTLIERNTGLSQQFDFHGPHGFYGSRLLPNNEIDVLTQRNDAWADDYRINSYTLNAHDLSITRGFTATPAICDQNEMFDCSIEFAHAYLKHGQLRFYSFQGGGENDGYEKLVRIQESSEICIEDVDYQDFSFNYDSFPLDTLSTPAIQSSTLDVSTQNVSNLFSNISLIRNEVCSPLYIEEKYAQAEIEIIGSTAILPEHLSGPGRVQLSSISGKTLYINSYKKNSIDLGFTDQFSPGIYILSVDAGDKQGVVKLVKQR